jgi:hypothetical protein
MSVLILKERLSPWDWATIVEGVEDYLEVMGEARVPDRAVAPLAQGLNAIKVWAGQVSVGGHSGFVTILRDKAVPTLRKALEAAEACDIPDWIDILNGTIAWIEANPDEAAVLIKSGGGSATELQALDRRFVESWVRSEKRLILVLPGHDQVRIEPVASYQQALQQEASRLRSELTHPDTSWAQLIATQCRSWLSDADDVAFALAWGKVGFRTFLPMGMRSTGLPDGSTYGEFLGKTRGGKHEIWFAVRGPSGLSFQTQAPPSVGRIVVTISQAEIENAQGLALAIRLPEIVGYSLASLDKELAIKSAFMGTWRAFPWLESRIRFVWSCEDWLVSATGKRVQFTDVQGKCTATFVSDQLRPGQRVEWRPNKG